jgi:hypothetical protein
MGRRELKAEFGMRKFKAKGIGQWGREWNSEVVNPEPRTGQIGRI